MDVLGHMLNDSKIYEMHLPKRGCVWDQTFANDTALYLKDSPSNLSKARVALELFCLASGAKINWGKSVVIWAMGTTSWAKMDPRGTRGSILRHPNRLPVTHRG
jgi:hypothetical protein